MIRWNRSEDGRAVSKCGRYEIEPRYDGRRTIQCYNLVHRGADGVSRIIDSACPTMRDCRAAADSWEAYEIENAKGAES